MTEVTVIVRLTQKSCSKRSARHRCGAAPHPVARAIRNEPEPRRRPVCAIGENRFHMFPNLTKMEALQSEVLDSSIAFLPELILCSAIVLLLLLRLFRALDHWHLGWVSLAFTLCALYVSERQWDETTSSQLTALPIFTGLLSYD